MHFGTDDRVGIISKQAIAFCQIVVGKIRTHPGLGHHRGGHFYDPADLGIIDPHFPSLLQRAVAVVFGRRINVEQAVLLPAGPGLDRHAAFPIRTMNGHLHRCDGSLPANIIKTVFDNRAGICAKCN